MTTRRLFEQEPGTTPLPDPRPPWLYTNPLTGRLPPPPTGRARARIIGGLATLAVIGLAGGALFGSPPPPAHLMPAAVAVVPVPPLRALAPPIAVATPTLRPAPATRAPTVPPPTTAPPPTVPLPTTAPVRSPRARVVPPRVATVRPPPPATATAPPPPTATPTRAPLRPSPTPALWDNDWASG